MGEIDKMMTISTGHVKQETFEMIPQIDNLVSYPKGDVGVFIYVPEELFIQDDEGNFTYPFDIPDDLYDCMLYSWGEGCRWLCLDRDGVICSNLTIYFW